MIFYTRILVVEILNESPIPPGASNPLAFIDNLYHELIEHTPPSVMETTFRILGTCIICPDLPVVHFAHLLGLRLEELYQALLALHSVINVPSEAKVAKEHLQFFHASFPDFLMSPERSGRLAQDVNLRRLQLAETCFHVLNYSEVSYADIIPRSLPEMYLNHGDDHDDEMMLRLSLWLA